MKKITFSGPAGKKDPRGAKPAGKAKETTSAPVVSNKQTGAKPEKKNLQSKGSAKSAPAGGKKQLSSQSILIAVFIGVVVLAGGYFAMNMLNNSGTQPMPQVPGANVPGQATSTVTVPGAGAVAKPPIPGAPSAKVPTPPPPAAVAPKKSAVTPPAPAVPKPVVAKKPAPAPAAPEKMAAKPAAAAKKKPAEKPAPQKIARKASSPPAPAVPTPVVAKKASHAKKPVSKPAPRPAPAVARPASAPAHHKAAAPKSRNTSRKKAVVVREYPDYQEEHSFSDFESPAPIRAPQTQISISKKNVPGSRLVATLPGTPLYEPSSPTSRKANAASLVNPDDFRIQPKSINAPGTLPAPKTAPATSGKGYSTQRFYDAGALSAEKKPADSNAFGNTKKFYMVLIEESDNLDEVRAAASDLKAYSIIPEVKTVKRHGKNVYWLTVGHYTSESKAFNKAQELRNTGFATSVVSEQVKN